MEKKTTSRIASTTIALGAAAAGGPLALFAAAAERITANVEDHWQELRRDRRARYFQACLGRYLDGEDVDVAEVEAFVQATADDPKLRGVIVDALRVLDDAPAEEAVFAMGKLTRLYRERRLRPDGFSRGVRRILQDATSEDLAALREVLNEILAIVTERDGVHLAFYPNRDPPVLSLMYLPTPTHRPLRMQGEPELSRHAVTPKAPSAAVVRALALMLAAHLANAGATNAANGVSGGDSMVIERSTARALLDLFP